MPGFARFAHKKPSSTIDNGESTSSTPTAGLSDLPSSSSGAPGPSIFSFEGKDREVESSTHRRVSFAQGVNDALDDRSVAEQPSFFSGFDFAEEEEPTANERFMTGFLSDPDDLEGGARSDSFAGASRSNPSYSTPATAKTRNGQGGIALFRGMQKPVTDPDPSQPNGISTTNFSSKAFCQQQDKQETEGNLPNETAQRHVAVPNFPSQRWTSLADCETPLASTANDAGNRVQAMTPATQAFMKDLAWPNDSVSTRVGASNIEKPMFSSDRFQQHTTQSKSPSSHSITDQPHRQQTTSLVMPKQNVQGTLSLPARNGNEAQGTKFSEQHYGEQAIPNATAHRGPMGQPLQSSMIQRSLAASNEPRGMQGRETRSTSNGVQGSSINSSGSALAHLGNREGSGNAVPSIAPRQQDTAMAERQITRPVRQENSENRNKPQAISNMRDTGLHLGRPVGPQNSHQQLPSRQSSGILRGTKAYGHAVETMAAMNRSEQSATPTLTAQQPTAVQANNKGLLRTSGGNDSPPRQDSHEMIQQEQILPPVTPVDQSQQRTVRRFVTPAQSKADDVYPKTFSAKRPIPEDKEQQGTGHSQFLANSKPRSTYQTPVTEHVFCRQETDAAIFAHSAKFDEQRQQHLMFQREFEDLIESFDENSLQAQVQLSGAHAELLFVLDDMADTQTELDAIEAMAMEAIEAVCKAVPAKSNEES